MSRPAIAYIRVSTASQGRSGLGIEAQREAIARFAAAEGFEIAAEFIEIETGKGSDALDRRPQLTGKPTSDGAGNQELPDRLHRIWLFGDLHQEG